MSNPSFVTSETQSDGSTKNAVVLLEVGTVKTMILWDSLSPGDQQLLTDTINAYGGVSPMAADTAGLQIAKFALSVTTSTATGLSPTASATAGTATVHYASETTGSSVTHLSAARTYSALLTIDGALKSVAFQGSAGVTFADVITAINADLGASATAALVAGNIVITSATTGSASSVTVQDSGFLFSSLSTYAGFTFATGVMSTHYTFTATVDGVAVPVDVVGGAAQTFATLLSEINTDLGSAAVATLVGGNIVITSATTGVASKVSLADGSLFRSIALFSGFGVSQDGAHDFIALFKALRTPAGGSYYQYFKMVAVDSSVTPPSGGGGTGPQGPAGPQGAVGPQGPAGAAGPQGAKGDTGDTGPIGTPGTVGLTGPAGAPGAKGDTGNTGPAGADSTVAGPTGPQGATGATGNTGPAGADSTVAGPTGPAGAPGAKGDKGDTGDVGPTGAASTVPGPAGAAGAKGDTGDTGAKGDQGDVGPTGNTGPAGADSTVAGPAGAPGAKGDTGDVGAKGDKGDTGDTGPAGTNGIDATAPLFTGTYFVTKNGSDTIGTGALYAPFATIQHAVDVASAATGLTSNAQVVVFPGRYVENVTITHPNVTLQGYGAFSFGTIIHGSVTATSTIAAASTAQTIYALKDIYIESPVNVDSFSYSGTVQATVRMDNVKLFSTGTGRGLVMADVGATSAVALIGVDIKTDANSLEVTNVKGYGRQFSAESTTASAVVQTNSNLQLAQPTLVADGALPTVQIFAGANTVAGGNQLFDSFGSITAGSGNAVDLLDSGATYAATGTVFIVTTPSAFAVQGVAGSIFQHANNAFAGSSNVSSVMTRVAIPVTPTAV